MRKLVAESLKEILEAKVDAKTDIKDKIKGLELQLKNAKKLGSKRDNLRAQKQKVADIEGKIAKFKAKLNEAYYGEDDDDDDDGDDNWENNIDGDGYWKRVAAAMNGELVSFDMDYDEEWREIIFNVNDMKIVVKHDWAEDGTETKPWTYINGNDYYGRLPIWEDEPNSYAKDILNIAHKQSFYEEEEEY